jgi:hypothetical protein
MKEGRAKVVTGRRVGDGASAVELATSRIPTNKVPPRLEVRSASLPHLPRPVQAACRLTPRPCFHPD